MTRRSNLRRALRCIFESRPSGPHLSTDSEWEMREMRETPPHLEPRANYSVMRRGLARYAGLTLPDRHTSAVFRMLSRLEAFVLRGRRKRYGISGLRNSHRIPALLGAQEVDRMTPYLILIDNLVDEGQVVRAERKLRRKLRCLHAAWGLLVLAEMSERYGHLTGAERLYAAVLEDLNPGAILFYADSRAAHGDTTGAEALRRRALKVGGRDAAFQGAYLNFVCRRLAPAKSSNRPSVIDQELMRALPHLASDQQTLAMLFAFAGSAEGRRKAQLEHGQVEIDISSSDAHQRLEELEGTLSSAFSEDIRFTPKASNEPGTLRQLIQFFMPHAQIGSMATIIATWMAGSPGASATLRSGEQVLTLDNADAEEAAHLLGLLRGGPQLKEEDCPR